MYPTLTGFHDTGQLPAITVEPVTVTVERTPKPGQRHQFAAALRALAAAAQSAPGSLGVGVLAGATDSDPWHIVFRFNDAIALRRWEASDERQNLVGRVQYHTASTKVVSAPSPSAWFAANDVPVETGVVKWTRDVLWAVPVALAMTLLVAPPLGVLPMPARVVVSTCLAAALYTATVAPARRWRRRRMVRNNPLI